jgi:hypothetical protein
MLGSNAQLICRAKSAFSLKGIIKGLKIPKQEEKKSLESKEKAD